MPADLFSTTTAVDIQTGCPMRYRVHEDDMIDIIAIGERHEFSISFHAEALRAFVETANEALAEIGAQAANGR
jgi:hypothetical protein